MINLTKLVTGGRFEGDRLRYGDGARASTAGAGSGVGPVVVWNCTRRCNLNCIHCYAGTSTGEAELSAEEARRFISDLARYRVPVLLVSGGEPLLRPDIVRLVEYAAKAGIRVCLSSNGTLLQPETARELKEAGLSYIGISLDGVGPVNDEFRGREGSFEAALAGIRYARAEGLKVGIRFTITRRNYGQIPSVLKLCEDEGISRVCFYHLAYSGRGRVFRDSLSLTGEETRAVIRLLVSQVKRWHEQGVKTEVLTVDNHADGAYVTLLLAWESTEAARRAWQYLRANGGNRAGMAIAAVDWNGGVHPDQFSLNINLGNIREEPFSSIWSDAGHPVLAMLRDRKRHLKGRCRKCVFIDICNGNLRARAEAATGDLWGEDPACYLTDEEIESRMLPFFETMR